MQKLIAVATHDPLHHRTFSGYSANLFNAIGNEGVRVVPVASRDLRWHDALTGALRPSALLAPRGGDQNSPKVNPNWFWSRRGFLRLCRRFDAALKGSAGPGTVLQVGTHVRTSLHGYRSFCVTDATITQARAVPRFSINKAAPRVIAEAVECQREVFFSCEKVFVLSRWTADSVTADYGYPAERVVVVGAGANLQNRRPRRIVSSAPYILFVGLDWEQKGGPLLLDAFRRLRMTHPTARLKVVGCTPSLPDDHVDVIGYVDKSTEAGQDQLLDLYSGATCFSILSAFDAFPNVLLEAGYMGVPVVSTTEGSRPEIVRDGTTGILVAQRDPDAIAAALRSLFDDPGRAEAMGMAAQRLVDAYFTWPVVAHNVLQHMGLTPAE